MPVMRGMGFDCTIVWESNKQKRYVCWWKIEGDKYSPPVGEAEIKDDSPEAIAKAMWEAAIPILEKEG